MPRRIIFHQHGVVLFVQMLFVHVALAMRVGDSSEHPPSYQPGGDNKIERLRDAQGEQHLAQLACYQLGAFACHFYQLPCILVSEQHCYIVRIYEELVGPHA